MQDKYKQFTENTYNGQDLLKKHSKSEKGLWQVFGEDPNCDFGGHHHNPFLGTFEGTLEEVICAAVNMHGFWQWGAGGEIKKVEVMPLPKPELSTEEQILAFLDSVEKTIVSTSIKTEARRIKKLLTEKKRG